MDAIVRTDRAETNVCKKAIAEAETAEAILAAANVNWNDTP